MSTMKRIQTVCPMYNAHMLHLILVTAEGNPDHDYPDEEDGSDHEKHGHGYYDRDNDDDDIDVDDGSC